MDERQRKLERAAASGDPEARAALLRGRIRAGTLTVERVRLGAFLGDEGARLLTHLDRHPGPGAAATVTPWTHADSWALNTWLPAASRLASDIRTGRRVPCQNRVPIGGNPGHPPMCAVFCLCDAPATNYGTVLATEACTRCTSGWVSVQPNCGVCNGTGRAPETLRLPFLVLAAVACARVVWRQSANSQLRRGAFLMNLERELAAIDAAEAWALDPSKERLRAMCEAQPGYTEGWLDFPAIATGVIRSEPAIQASARATSDPECREAIRGLAGWVLA